MKIIFALGRKRLKFKKSFLTIGVFDGIHRGHRILIEQLVRRARALRGTSVVMTFWPHPIHVLYPQMRCPLLTSLPQRLELIEELGVQACVVIPFTKTFSRLSAQRFIQEYIVQNIQPQEIILGDDFRFGQNRQGDLGLLKAFAKRHGFRVRIIKAIQKDQRRISSSRIRALIARGKLLKARRLLGHCASLWGRVIKGDARGKRLGFPTANIQTDHAVFVPHGVYLVWVTIGKTRHQGIANIGLRPSFPKTKRNPTLEVHILDFHRGIYGQGVIVELIKKLRNERKFSSSKELVAQIERDEKRAREYFQKRKAPLKKHPR